MSSKHHKTLEAIFDNPVRSDVEWKKIESLFVSLGAEISEGRGSRVRVALNEVRAVFHRPHPQKETDKGALKSVRNFLNKAGITPKKSRTMLKHKGYHGKVEFDEEAGLFHGEVVDLRDVITFQGKSVDELEKAFKDSIEDYLEFCEERNEEPDKPFSGRLMLRLSTEIHRKVYIGAKKEGKSLNEYISDKLSLLN